MAYCGLYRDHPDLASMFDLKFFVIPFIRNLTSEFIARHDSWYSRHIFTPFFADHVLYPYQESNNLAEYQESEPHVIGRNLKRLSELYITQASETLNIRMW